MAGEKAEAYRELAAGSGERALAADPVARELAGVTLAMLDVYAALLEARGHAWRAWMVRQRAEVIALADPHPGLAVVTVVARDLRELARLLPGGGEVVEEIADRIEARAHLRRGGDVPGHLLEAYGRRSLPSFGKLLDKLDEDRRSLDSPPNTQAPDDGSGAPPWAPHGF